MMDECDELGASCESFEEEKASTKNSSYNDVGYGMAMENSSNNDVGYGMAMECMSAAPMMGAAMCAAPYQPAAQ